MSENLSVQEMQRATELANLASQVYKNGGGEPKNEWKTVITSVEVSSIAKEGNGKSSSGYFGAVYRKPDGTYDSQGKPNYEYALVHRGTDDWEDIKVDIKTGIDILPEKQFQDANRLLNQAKSMDSKFSEAVYRGEVVNVGHSLGGLLAKLFGATMGSNEIVAYNSPGGKHLLNDAAEYWDKINNTTGTTNLTNRDYSDIVKEINAWGDPVSKIGGFGIGKEYNLSQSQSFLGSLLIENPITEVAATSLGVATIFGAKTFHSMENLENQLNGQDKKLIDDAKVKYELNAVDAINSNQEYFLNILDLKDGKIIAYSGDVNNILNNSNFLLKNNFSDYVNCYQDNKGNKFSIVNNILIPLKDGTIATVESVIEAIDYSIEATANFLTYEAQKTADIIIERIKSDSYLDSLIGSVLADVILGENDPKQIAKTIAI